MLTLIPGGFFVNRRPRADMHRAEWKVQPLLDPGFISPAELSTACN